MSAELVEVRGQAQRLAEAIAALGERADEIEGQTSVILDRLSRVLETLETHSASAVELRDSVTQLHSLVASTRDDIPRLRSQLRMARKSADYDAAFSEPSPLVSIRIASYDQTESLMDRALASALGQSYDHLEVVVVNDGPNEGTRRAIESLRDPRIRYTELPHRSVYPSSAHDRWLVAGSPGMNEAVALSRGAWIAPLDDDDEFTDDHVERLLALCQSERAELGYGALDRFEFGADETSERIFSFPPERGGFSFQAALYVRALDFFEYDQESWRVSEPGDWNLCRRMLAAGVRMAAIPDVVGHLYRTPLARKG